MVMLPFKSIQLTQIFGMHKVNCIPLCNSVSEHSLPHNLGHGTQQHQIRRNNANLHTRTLTRTLTHTRTLTRSPTSSPTHALTHAQKIGLKLFRGKSRVCAFRQKFLLNQTFVVKVMDRLLKQLRYNTAVKSLPAPVQGFTATVQWFTT